MHPCPGEGLNVAREGDSSMLLLTGRQEQPSGEAAFSQKGQM